MDYPANEVLKQTDSQKSMTTSNIYSMDFTDSSSEKHNSSGMETYVLEWDSEGSESPRSKSINVKEIPIMPIVVNTSKQCILSNTVSSTSIASGIRRSIIAQEIYTQTSKTIIELAQSDGVALKTIDCKSLETQTSLLSIKGTINQIQYEKIENTSSYKSVDILSDEIANSSSDQSIGNYSTQQLPPESKMASERTSSTISPVESDKNIPHVNPSSLDSVTTEKIHKYVTNSDFSSDDTDIEEDSLAESHEDTLQNKVNTGLHPDTSCTDTVTEFYNKLYDKLSFRCSEMEQYRKRVGQLTPLSEESIAKPDSLTDLTSCNLGATNNDDTDVLFTNNAGIKVKLFPDEQEAFKLPPININSSGQISNNLDFLFTTNNNKYQQNSEMLTPPFPQNTLKDRHAIENWQMNAKDALASGESPLISGRSGNDTPVKPPSGGVQLPPINLDNFGANIISRADCSMLDYLAPEASPISINKKIKELKLSSKNRSWSPPKYQNFRKCRSDSPSITGFDSKSLEVADRSAELLCFEILKKLRSTSWYEVMETLIDIPNILQNSWQFLTENRIADILRQVSSQVESPRTQIARAACKTLSIILTSTNYTKKPDFYEAVTILLIKTGSFSRPVRHAANVALDKIVCAVQPSEVITVLCIHGVSHKSALVRCAVARLLVVCCALGGGGRALLRARPPSAATARRHALRSLSQLLDDKSTDTRKYAVRLYAMLRPLSNFEAYYLSDVDVELATLQMKKFDQLLSSGTREPR